MAANQARKDLRQKIILERELAKKIRAFNKQLVKRTVRTFGLGSMTFNAELMMPELEQILRDHYEKTGSVFNDQITKKLPSDIEASDEERLLIASAMASFFATRAPEQARIITSTNNSNISTSISRALDIGQENAISGRPQTRIETGLIAGANLNRLLNGRVMGISTLETQAVAEAAKATEAQVLTFQQPSVTGGTPREAEVKKEWLTAGDEKVRQDHVLADGDEVDLNGAFTVGGQRLRWPGDTSLGATASNVINCRCTSFTPPGQVFAVRRRRGQVATTDISISEQLLTSLGG